VDKIRHPHEIEHWYWSGGVLLALATGDGVWDGAGTICIGVLLVLIAVVLAVET
jgi:hypothetical protein